MMHSTQSIEPLSQVNLKTYVIMLYVQLYENYFHNTILIYARVAPKMRSPSESKRQHNNCSLSKQAKHSVHRPVVFSPLSQSLPNCTMSKSLHNFGLFALELDSLGQIQSKLGNKDVRWHLTGMCVSGKCRCTRVPKAYETSWLVMRCQMACLR